MAETSKWITVAPAMGACSGRLICLPFAGGGTAIYYPWRDLLLPDVELIRIQLPGRETRLREKPFTRIEPLVSALADELMPLLDRPFFFFGHSMGALIAFELSRELRRNHDMKPSHLFLSGRRAAQIPDPEPPIYDLPDDEFLDHLRQYQGIPEMVLANKELRELFLPILRADFDLLDNYAYLDEAPLACPITALGGLSDPKNKRDDIMAWQYQTDDRFESHFLPGGHFYLNESKTILIDHINKSMRSSVSFN